MHWYASNAPRQRAQVGKPWGTSHRWNSLLCGAARKVDFACSGNERGKVSVVLLYKGRLAASCMSMSACMWVAIVLITFVSIDNQSAMLCGHMFSYLGIFYDSTAFQSCQARQLQASERRWHPGEVSSSSCKRLLGTMLSIWLHSLLRFPSLLIWEGVCSQCLWWGIVPATLSLSLALFCTHKFLS